MYIPALVALQRQPRGQLVALQAVHALMIRELLIIIIIIIII